ncbi:MAG: L,D-transpeptidase family protein, partial [Verrucomicrobiales bacterium]
TTYPIVQTFGDVTTVKVNGTQRPATINHRVLAKCSQGTTEVRVDIDAQRAYLIVDGEVGIDTPVSTAKADMYTPRGVYSITERVRSGKISNLYHCEMPNWMRLGSTAVGMHAGYLPGYPASHGCIRCPASVVPYIFDHTRSGTKVTVR